MFILSEGLTRTGVANRIGQWVLKMAGTGEVRLIVVVMLTAGGLSAIMNNIGVAALMLPVVIHIARRTGCAPSRLLMPSGLRDLAGRSDHPDRDTAEPAGQRRPCARTDWLPFGLFSFTPVGLTAMLAGIAFRRLARAFFPAENGPGQGVGRGDRSRAGVCAERPILCHAPAAGVTAGRHSIG